MLKELRLHLRGACSVDVGADGVCPFPEQTCRIPLNDPLGLLSTSSGRLRQGKRDRSFQNHPNPGMHEAAAPSPKAGGVRPSSKPPRFKRSTPRGRRNLSRKPPKPDATNRKPGRGRRSSRNSTRNIHVLRYNPGSSRTEPMTSLFPLQRRVDPWHGHWGR